MQASFCFLFRPFPYSPLLFKKTTFHAGRIVLYCKSVRTDSQRLRGISSAGRAPGSQSGGQGFDPPMLHKQKLFCLSAREFFGHMTSPVFNIEITILCKESFLAPFINNKHQDPVLLSIFSKRLLPRSNCPAIPLLLFSHIKIVSLCHTAIFVVICYNLINRNPNCRKGQDL